MADEATPETVYPASASGLGDNTHCISCEVYGGRRHYAVCLKTLERVHGGAEDRNPYDTSCRVEINSGGKDCIAMPMQKEEMAAGKALYYVSRAQIGYPPLPPEQIFDPRFERGFRQPTGPRQNRVRTEAEGGKPERKSRVKIEPANLDGINLHAELVNVMVKDGKK